MFAILAEDRSDAEALAVLVRRIAGDERLPLKRKGFSGCGELRNRAASQIIDFFSQGATRFIICHDSDGDDPETVRNRLRNAIKEKIDLRRYEHIIAVPIEELESWIIADECAIASVIRSLRIGEIRQPESVANPKEWLRKQSCSGRSTPLYAPASHNPRVAQHLNIEKVKAKCRSFEELVEFIRSTP